MSEEKDLEVKNAKKNDENDTWVEHCLLCLHGVVGLDGCSPICF